VWRKILDILDVKESSFVFQGFCEGPQGHFRASELLHISKVFEGTRKLALEFSVQWPQISPNCHLECRNFRLSFAFNGKQLFALCHNFHIKPGGERVKLSREYSKVRIVRRRSFKLSAWGFALSRWTRPKLGRFWQRNVGVREAKWNGWRYYLRGCGMRSRKRGNPSFRKWPLLHSSLPTFSILACH